MLASRSNRVPLVADQELEEVFGMQIIDEIRAYPNFQSVFWSLSMQAMPFVILFKSNVVSI